MHVKFMVSMFNIFEHNFSFLIFFLTEDEGGIPLNQFKPSPVKCHANDYSKVLLIWFSVLACFWCQFWYCSHHLCVLIIFN